ncbi:DNA/RNA polymerases superfamily protein [Gossypium australe]|uniref:DNA/RNA polymerases superfamily protein n=1 Tax=Gossypium australe TaxID=47621 RepID=A0A5B6VBX9_9ROSI|nr:DNA/RNA polymerases superfamily protein [Gossypium australe]
MDFMSGLQLSLRKRDIIWVIVDHLTKSAHFIPIDDHSEQVIQILDDMLRCCILEFEGSSGKILSLVEFTSNNNYHSSIKMAPYKDLYGRRKDIEFQVGDRVFLKVSAWRKLSPHFIGPYEVIERIGSAAYHLALPSELEKIHNVFHVWMLKRYRPNPSHVLFPIDVEIQPNMLYGEKLVKILAWEVKELRNKCVALVKVLWHHHGVEEAT